MVKSVVANAFRASLVDSVAQMKYRKSPITKKARQKYFDLGFKVLQYYPDISVKNLSQERISMSDSKIMKSALYWCMEELNFSRIEMERIVSLVTNRPVLMCMVKYEGRSLIPKDRSVWALKKSEVSNLLNVSNNLMKRGIIPFIVNFTFYVFFV